MTKEDLHIRVDTEIMQPVREYAAQNGVSLAAAISIILRRGLRRHDSNTTGETS